LYLPVGIDFSITADTACDLAFCYCRAEQHYRRTSSRRRVRIEIRAEQCHPQINHILTPEFPASAC